MNHHDYMACQLAACQLCQGYEDGYSAGQATLARTLRHVGDHGSFPSDVDAIKSCAEPCEHDYCALVTTLGWLYFHVSKYLDGINADLWEKNNPHLAEQLRDALRSDDADDDGTTHGVGTPPPSPS